ncbi:Enoyl-CoA hydratase/carnithine racemase [Tistlia consotensis]|uniref:Enoyl-CoA hydratase/carnithine racemase n=1 Tax=Tistlia consotensis USBA 355 TaxID=560819 RepID=A0A1Y6B855_9PROT|nr:enoyl-CoA hydratase family protein [Tistlia consotensis]SME89335.1 Enoyl-CoA hydratase/carnithine racemase [Tistlia consotensis USBA 355]SNR25874.1 Enoyl-CoA hydratase/carnithine racemase [Tistlia consotensis]
MTPTETDSTRVRAERRGAVLLLTLDGPRTRNAIGPQVYREVQARVLDAGLDPAVGAIVVTGDGGFFSSGGNVRALRESAARSLAAATANTDGLNGMIRAVVDGPKPAVAAVEGGAAGAGVALALACDLIVASDAARFTVAHVRVGLSPDGGATHFLRSALPRQLVMELCLLGQPLPAERLAQAGVVNRLVPAGEALPAALELAERLAAGPPQALGGIKRLVNAAPENGLAAHLELEARSINLARFGPEAAEGLTAFLEKRRPDFASAGRHRGPRPAASPAGEAR